MIFVTVGTNEARFDRLVAAVGDLPAGEEIVLQHGASQLRPANAHCIESLPFTELVDHVRRARVVVTHAGVGSILVAAASGRRPVVVPRLHRYGEAVDDHQVALARRLASVGVATLVEDPYDLAAALSGESPRDAGAPLTVGSAPLERELGAFLTECVAARNAP